MRKYLITFETWSHCKIFGTQKSDVFSVNIMAVNEEAARTKASQEMGYTNSDIPYKITKTEEIK